MTQEEKQLLFKDLCIRLPYHPIVSVAYNYSDKGIIWDFDVLRTKLLLEIEENDSWEYIKPYLRTMDSMTEEEVEEYRSIQSDIWKECGTQYYDNWRSIRWLYEHNFNVSLPEHLFIKVTKENNPYKQ